MAFSIGCGAAGAAVWCRGLKPRLAVALVASLVLGVLRGEYLRYQEPSLEFASSEGTRGLATVVMSADRGVLAFVQGSHSAQFIPWDKIETIPEKAGESSSIRGRAAGALHWGRYLVMEALPTLKR